MRRALWYLDPNPRLTYGWAQPILTTSTRLLSSSHRFFCFRSLCGSFGTAYPVCSRSCRDRCIGGSARSRSSLCSSSRPHRAPYCFFSSFLFIRRSSPPLSSLCASSRPCSLLCGPPCPDRSLCCSSRPCRSRCRRTAWQCLHPGLRS